MQEFNAQGKVVRSTDLAGRVTTTAWDCCHKISETKPDGQTTTWDYDTEGRMIASSRLIPLDATNVTWVTTCYRYDAMGRQTATWTTNYTEHVGTPATTTSYDGLGRVISRTIPGRGTSLTRYSANGLVVTNIAPNGATTVVRYPSYGERVSIVGTAVTPEFRSINVVSNGVRYVKVTRGLTSESSRWARQYRNMLGQVVREESSGINGSVRKKEYRYDCLGRIDRISVDGEPDILYGYDTMGDCIEEKHIVFKTSSLDSSEDKYEWRRYERHMNYSLKNLRLWRTMTNVLSCSDSSIAPVVTYTSEQLSGLTIVNPSVRILSDAYDNITKIWEEYSDGVVYVHKKSSEIVCAVTTKYRFGMVVESLNPSSGLVRLERDSLGRVVAQIDGRGNAYAIGYDIFGRRISSSDGAGNSVSYGYDNFGRLIVATNALGYVTNYEYDLRGHKIFDGGATYPVRYSYDVFGNRVSATTYRNESSGADFGDVEIWNYDEATGLVTNKLYASGVGVSYDYDVNGRLKKRTWARGVDTYFEYDCWGNLAKKSYSDNTPPVEVKYDALSRKIETHDAAGVTIMHYDAYGANTNETVFGDAVTNTLERYFDEFGRVKGYAINGDRHTIIDYDGNGRVGTMFVGLFHSVDSSSQISNQFSWSYYPDCNLKRSLEYPDHSFVTYEYEPNRDYITLVSNDVYCSFACTYDEIGRRVSVGDDIYYYNNRGELICASNMLTGVNFSYIYDDAGNRRLAFENGINSIYHSNELNQYTNVVSGNCGCSGFDLDGNQTNIVLSTGVWTVEYNGENQPVRWTRTNLGSNDVVKCLIMAYDFMGRRVAKNDERYFYDGYLQILAKRVGTSAYGNVTVWDPTEKVATKPLAWCDGKKCINIAHDANKNVVCEFCDRQSTRIFYTPFGSVVGVDHGMSPWRFSSEYKDAETGLMYYIHRFLRCDEGRWITRDPFGELYPLVSVAIPDNYVFLSNDPVNDFDLRGLDSPGCDIVGAIPGWESDCRLRCCAKHDECYDVNKCTAWSWFNPLNPFSCRTKCDDCNSEVVACTLMCFGGADPLAPKPWDFDKKPNGGKYYCAKSHMYVSDPADCQ